MKFSLESSAGYSIRSYSEGRIEVISRIAQPESEGIETVTLTGSAIISAEYLVTDWGAVSSKELTQALLEPVLASRPEVILLGTGDRLVFPAPEIMQYCHQAGVGIEVMDTGGACRTYNVLSSEGRRVTAALIMEF